MEEVIPKVYIESNGTWENDSFEVWEWGPVDAVESAVKIFVSERDGWEWIESGERFLVRQNGEEVVQEFEISIDYEPVYSARRID